MILLRIVYFALYSPERARNNLRHNGVLGKRSIVHQIPKKLNVFSTTSFVV